MSEPRLSVLIADDQPHMRQMLRLALGRDDFIVVGEATDGVEAIAMAEQLRPDVVLIDLVMPNLDGVGAIKELRARKVPVRALVLTSNGDRESVARALAAGADGYVLKGAAGDEIRAAVRQVGRGAAVLAPDVARGVVDDYAKLLERMRERDLAVIRTLAGAVEARDKCTGDHINNVADLGMALWRQMMGAPPDDELVYGFLLHDVGKISVPDAILLKAGPLDADERARMQLHVEIGVQLIEPLGFGSAVTDIIRCHHERFDGGGYPAGLAGRDIPEPARMFSIVDAYDAMTADRPYRRGMSPAEALAELVRFSGSQFDPEYIREFERLVEKRGLL